MRDAVEIIHRAIQRIDDPLMIAGLISPDTFFAVKRVTGEFVEKQFADQLLRLNIDLQLDVMCCHRVHTLPLPKILAKQLSRFTRGIFSCIEITLHGPDYVAQRTQSARRKKTGRKIYSPPGLKLVCDPEEIGAVS